MKIYITFGDDNFKEARRFSAKMAKLRGGFDKTIEYKPEDIEPDFKLAHEDVFSIKRGYGLWLWKPYFIWKTLTEVANYGDLVFYADAGSFLIRNIGHIEKVMGESEIFVSSIPFVEWQFTKADAFRLMNCDNKEIKNSAQYQGGFICIRKSDDSIRFIKQWLDKCSDIRYIHPDNLTLGIENPKGFIAHREDQSILSLLCKKEGIKAHQDPTQYAKYPEKYVIDGYETVDTGFIGKREYPVCIILHRSPKADLLSCIKPLLLLLLPRCLGLYLIKHGVKNKLF